MKKKFKRLFFKDNGSVSIYAIIIILPIFMLNALLIDTLRIMSAERQIENAMDTALRSTMAEFDTKLASVGLFAYGGESADADFNRFINKQFYNSVELSGYENLSSPEIITANANFTNERNLVDYDVFEHQILESMKYQAPAQIGEALFTLVGSKNLNNITEEQVENAKNVSENYEKILELTEKRNDEIDKAVKEYKHYSAVFKDDIPNKIIGNPVTDNSKDKKIPSGIKTFEELIFYYDRYHKLKKKEELKDGEQQEIDNYEKNYNEDVAFSYYLNVIAGKEIKNALVGKGGSLSSPAKNSAKWYNKEIKKILDKGKGKSLKALESLYLDKSFFETVINNMDKVNKELDLATSVPIREILKSQDLTNLTITQLIMVFYVVIKKEKFKDLALLVKDAVTTKTTNIVDTQLVAIDDQFLLYEDSKKELKSEEYGAAKKEAKTSFSDLLNSLGSARELGNDQQVYDELEGIMASYNAATNGGGDKEESDRLQFISDAFNRFKEFVNFVHGFPEEFRNQLYINEYILANYGTSPPYELIDAESYLFKNKQGQFITYGYGSAGTNYFMFIKDIVLVLFVVNLMESMVKGGFAGPVGFLRAVGQAFIFTGKQLTNITTGDYVLEWQPFKIAQIDMTMPMFLRIFMMMRSTGESYNHEKLRRLQAVITKDTGVDLNKAPSYIEGNVKGKIKLWFIPALTEVIPNQYGNVKGSYYYINKKKVYSY
ncbi:hypothetical protein [Virgibacillus phasianinus]|nr:hypothetical protein [Virgibacillus phasianinus]